MPTLNTIEINPDSNGPRLTPAESAAVKIPEDKLLEEKWKDVKVFPEITTNPVDDCPDGGFAAWCVVLGVSESTISLPSQSQ